MIDIKHVTRTESVNYNRNKVVIVDYRILIHITNRGREIKPSYTIASFLDLQNIYFSLYSQKLT